MRKNANNDIGRVIDNCVKTQEDLFYPTVSPHIHRAADAVFFGVRTALVGTSSAAYAAAKGVQRAMMTKRTT